MFFGKPGVPFLILGYLSGMHVTSECVESSGIYSAFLSAALGPCKYIFPLNVLAN